MKDDGIFKIERGNGYLSKSHDSYDYYDCSHIRARLGLPIDSDDVYVPAVDAAVSSGLFVPNSDIWLLDIAVGVDNDPLHLRKQGIGSNLLREMESWGVNLDCRRVVGHLLPYRQIYLEKTKSFYLKNGYNIIEESGFKFIVKDLI